MSARSFTRAVRAPLARQLVGPATQRRTIVALASTSRSGHLSALRRPINVSLHQNRGVKTIDFAGHKETVYGTLTNPIRLVWVANPSQNEKIGLERNSW